ncbi:MAG: hypothetical protein KH365_02455 [Clostridiales bacterium]|nr:hypothetical protein [Clostridiales bacterium]
MDNKNNETKEYILTEEELKAVSGGTSSQIPGITCPNCGKFIPTTITDLLTQSRLRCPYCLLVLNVRRKQS